MGRLTLQGGTPHGPWTHSEFYSSSLAPAEDQSENHSKRESRESLFCGRNREAHLIASSSASVCSEANTPRTLGNNCESPRNGLWGAGTSVVNRLRSLATLRSHCHCELTHHHTPEVEDSDKHNSLISTENITLHVCTLSNTIHIHVCIYYVSIYNDWESTTCWLSYLF